MSGTGHFAESTRAWFEDSFAGPTQIQERGWPEIAKGAHALLCAPTGSGKTLAAFLSALDRLANRGTKSDVQMTSVVYVSPLKALVYDIDRNLRAPLAGIARTAQRLGHSIRLPTVAVRTGDTSAKERRSQLRFPGDILVTTPESLYLLLGSAAREGLANVETVIIDEVHALAPTKRGAHLSLSLERLAALCETDPQRIGLSATAHPLETVAAFLGGDREVTIVDTSKRPAIDIRIVAAAADMTRPEETALIDGKRTTIATNLADSDDGPSESNDGEHEQDLGFDLDPDEPPPGSSSDTGMWAAILPALVHEIEAHSQTIVFVNSRALAERLTQRICEISGAPIARAHHGSLAHSERRVIEEQLKNGELPAIVATSSLELGIDMGAVDLVLLVEAPKSTASGLQRIGRAGHSVGEVSIGRLLPKHRGDLLEAAAVVGQMSLGAIEAITLPQNPLDVLAQHVVAAVASKSRTVEVLGRMFRRSANFRNLPESAYLGVLDMLAGRYPSTAFSDLRARIDWDRQTDELVARRGSKMLAIIGGGTIPDRGTYAVYLGEDGPRLGELDEEMVNETTPGQTFTLGASTWRVARVTRDRVIVSPAPGEVGKLPFWRGEGPGRPLELGHAIGKLVRRIEDASPEQARELLATEHHLDEAAIDNLLAYVSEQATESALPTDRRIVVERFRDELGDYRVCILTPFGSRVHAPWALSLESTLAAKTGLVIQSMWSDDGIVMRFLDGDAMPTLEDMFPPADDIERLVIDQLGASALFASQFRQNAARSLLLPRRRPGERTPLWLQRLKSQQLLSIARDYPAFPVIMETYRSCLSDVFDMAALEGILRGVEDRSLEVTNVETASASPFAKSLVFAYVATYLYEGDAPLAERRAQALALDRDLLRELLGGDKLRELLEPDVITKIEHTMLRRGRVRNAGQLLDLLRRVGDLTEDEIAAACGPAPEPADDEYEPGTDAPAKPDALLNELVTKRQAHAITLGDGPHWIASQDAALYRDALGSPVPAGAPASLLGPVENPLDNLLLRFARTRGPFTAEFVGTRYRVSETQATAVLSALSAAGHLLKGGFRRSERDVEFCHPEVLRRIKQGTLAVLRGQVAPVDGPALARFLPAWHGIGSSRRGMARLEEVVAQLEGLPLAFTELETVLLPARVADYKPAMLDELGAQGAVVWIGVGASGPRDGRVALYRREQVAALAPPRPQPDDEAIGAIGKGILDHLKARGASFFVAISSEIDAAEVKASSSELLEALWNLVWLGLVTNDTFGPLRTRAKRKPSGTKSRARGLGLAVGGRWSLVADLLTSAPAPTVRAHSRAISLLERHGVLCRESVAIEDGAGGFTAIYPVLRAMEENGRARRGYFVDGLGGAQFTLPGAVDRLRAIAGKEHREVVSLAAVDPANPYGWLLPWPAHGDGAAPRRAVGATVVLRGGVPVLFIDRGGKRLVSFESARDPEVATEAATALRDVARRHRGRSLRIQTIDGEPPRRSPLADALIAAGFYADATSMVLEVNSSARR